MLSKHCPEKSVALPAIGCGIFHAELVHFFTILKYPTSKSRVVQWLPLRGSDNNLGFGSINLGFPDNEVPI